jgi:hypothetical protein
MVELHVEPPAVAVAVTGDSIDGGVAMRRLERVRFEFGEFLCRRIEVSTPEQNYISPRRNNASRVG